MSSSQDPFYIVKDEIQESIDKLQENFHKWEQTPSDTGECVHLTKDLLASCESLEWQVDELEKAIAVATRDPSWYGLSETELEKRRRWTSTAHKKVGTVSTAVKAGREKTTSTHSGHYGMRQELMRLSNGPVPQASQGKHYVTQVNDDFISSESDRQFLLMKQQDEELDGISARIGRIGGVGLTIHEELIGQEMFLGEISIDMESTSDRLGFVQKRIDIVMKKAGAKGQFMMILSLLVLFIILFVFVFLT